MAHTTDTTDAYDVYLAGEDNYWDCDTATQNTPREACPTCAAINYHQPGCPEESMTLTFVDDRPIWERIRDQKAETEAIAELDRLAVEIIDCQLDGVQDDDPDYQDMLNRFWALHDNYAI